MGKNNNNRRNQSEFESSGSESGSESDDRNRNRKAKNAPKKRQDDSRSRSWSQSRSRSSDASKKIQDKILKRNRSRTQSEDNKAGPNDNCEPRSKALKLERGYHSISGDTKQQLTAEKEDHRIRSVNEENSNTQRSTLNRGVILNDTSNANCNSSNSLTARAPPYLTPRMEALFRSGKGVRQAKRIQDIAKAASKDAPAKPTE